MEYQKQSPTLPSAAVSNIVITGAVPPCWQARPDPLTMLTTAVDHAVVPQLLRPVLSCFMVQRDITIKTPQDAALSVTELFSLDSISPDGINFISALPMLTAPDFSNARSDVSAEFFGNVLPLCRRTLTSLCIGTCRYVNEESLAPVVAIVPNLRILSLHDCKHVGEQTLAVVARLSLLEDLTLDSCQKVDTEGLQHLAKLGHLTKLSLRGIKALAMEGVRTVVQVRTLTDVDVSYCHRLGFEEIQMFRNSLPNLASLEYKGCYKVFVVRPR